MPFQANQRDAIAERVRARLRAVLGDENLVTIFLGELVAGVEAQAQGGHMRAKGLGRWGKFAARALAAERGIRHRSAVAIGKAEV